MGIVQEIEINHSTEWYMHKPESIHTKFSEILRYKHII